jgi:hypothetical protein
MPNVDETNAKYNFNDAALAAPDNCSKLMCFGLSRLAAGISQEFYELSLKIEALKKQTAILPLLQHQLGNVLRLMPGWDPVQQRVR